MHLHNAFYLLQFSLNNAIVLLLQSDHPHIGSSTQFSHSHTQNIYLIPFVSSYFCPTKKSNYFVGSGKSTILRILLGLEPIRAMGLGSAPHSDSDPLKQSVTLPLGGLPMNMPIPVHRHDALPNAQGVLSIDGMDVSGYDRVPCFAMAGQDSDLFRGYSCSNSSYFDIILLPFYFYTI